MSVILIRLCIYIPLLRIMWFCMYAWYQFIGMEINMHVEIYALVRQSRSKDM